MATESLGSPHESRLKLIGVFEAFALKTTKLGLTLRLSSRHCWSIRHVSVLGYTVTATVRVTYILLKK